MNINNIINGLVEKRSRLLRYKAIIREDYIRQTEKVDCEIEKINNIFSELQNMIEPCVCPNCHGNGEIKRLDAAGDTEECFCTNCNGTGIKYE